MRLVAIASATLFALTASPLMADEPLSTSSLAIGCREKNFDTFFEGFSRASWPERQPYLAPSIRVVKAGKTVTVPRLRYRGYDITIVDYTFATASSFALFDAGKRRSFDKINHNAVRLANGDYRVLWSRGRYEIVGDDPEESLVAEFGPKQSYVFQKTASCWQLVEDRTGPTPAARR